MRTEHGCWNAYINIITINLQLKSDFMYCSYNFFIRNKIYQSWILLYSWVTLLIINMEIWFGDIRT